MKEVYTIEKSKKDITEIIHQSFSKIAPFWPLKNLIAVNPLQGFEELAFEEALQIGAAYFEKKELPEKMHEINRETLKWLQAFFDDGQATITMPFRNEGLYNSWRKLAQFDHNLHQNDPQKKRGLKILPKTAKEAVAQYLSHLGIEKENQSEFLSLLLSTLPGWAAFIKYRTEWSKSDHLPHNPVTQEDYLAIRLVITTHLWPEAKALLEWHSQSIRQQKTPSHLLEKMEMAEKNYRLPLVKELATQSLREAHIPEAQWVFCIDTRSESFRKCLESTGDYQTFGFAGFFGIPLQITNTITSESYASCPVLLTPQYEVENYPCDSYEKEKNGYERISLLKKLYQSLKYNFITPFALVETIGLMSGAWMAMRSLLPRSALRLKKLLISIFYKSQLNLPSLKKIPIEHQCQLALSALKMMGLTSHFAPIVVLCGHGSFTQNNPYASALDCGACGGRHGASNAQSLAAILNNSSVRSELYKNGIEIPEKTRFIAAEHTTTTDEIIFFEASNDPLITKLKDNLLKARQLNCSARARYLEKKANGRKSFLSLEARSQDWAEVRPEWGLARNAAFIIAPRDLSSSLNLEGRCFLHSYDYQQDPDGRFLTQILTAPMIVAQWINAQYLFSTMNNVAYGGGSKITQNITGKIGMMQGNASDLMTGLPLQSVYSTDQTTFHETQRLLTVVFAPKNKIANIIHAQKILEKLFRNGWVQLVSIQPEDRHIYLLNRNLTWQLIQE